MFREGPRVTVTISNLEYSTVQYRREQYSKSIRILWLALGIRFHIKTLYINFSLEVGRYLNECAT